MFKFYIYDPKGLEREDVRPLKKSCHYGKFKMKIWAKNPEKGGIYIEPIL
jgi:hypothetical protein